MTFQLRGEAQDSLNHAMFAAPNAAPANSLFGSVNAIVGTGQRRITFAGKPIRQASRRRPVHRANRAGPGWR